MIPKYSVAEARANLPKILDAVEDGYQVKLTRRGKPVAVLLSVQEYERLTGGYCDFSAAYEAHRLEYSGLERADLAGLREYSEGRRVTL